LASANLRSRRTATHPTCPTHPIGGSELSALSTLSGKGRSLRNQTLLEITPKGNGELARHCNDHDALNTPAREIPWERSIWPLSYGLVANPRKPAT